MYTVYTKPDCPQCDQAKRLLEAHDLPYVQVIVDVGQQKLPDESYISINDLKALVPGLKSVPQVFRGDSHIGQFNQLRMHVASVAQLIAN